MTPSPGPIQPHHAGSPSRVIQGYFPGGRPRIIQAAPAPVAPFRPQVPAPIQARPGSPPAPLLPGRPATGALQPSLRPGQPPRPILPTKVQPGAVQPDAPLRPQVPQPILPQRATPAAVQPHAGEAFPLPGNFTLKPRGSGQPLPEPIQKKMETFFNTSFTAVRVHVGSEAPSIGALAFTHGTDLYFAPGQYNPQTSQGQRLLGHELTHVLQQRAGRVRNPLGSGITVVHEPALEAEAERMGQEVSKLTALVQPKQSWTSVARTSPFRIMAPAHLLDRDRRIPLEHAEVVSCAILHGTVLGLLGPTQRGAACQGTLQRASQHASGSFTFQDLQILLNHTAPSAWALTGGRAVSMTASLQGISASQRSANDVDILVKDEYFMALVGKLMDRGFKGVFPGPTTDYSHLKRSYSGFDPANSQIREIDIVKRSHPYYTGPLRVHFYEEFGVSIVSPEKLKENLERRLGQGKEWEGIEEEKKKKAEFDLNLLNQFKRNS